MIGYNTNIIVLALILLHRESWNKTTFGRSCISRRWLFWVSSIFEYVEGVASGVLFSLLFRASVRFCWSVSFLSVNWFIISCFPRISFSWLWHWLSNSHSVCEHLILIYMKYTYSPGSSKRLVQQLGRKRINRSFQ